MSYSHGSTATGRLEAGQLNTVWVCCDCWKSCILLVGNYISFYFFCFSVFHFLVVGFVRRYREIAPRVNKQMCIEKAVPIQ